MLGIDNARAHPWFLLPPDLVVTCARVAPGISVIAFIIQLVLTAEQQAEMVQGTVLVAIGVRSDASISVTPPYTPAVEGCDSSQP